MQMNQKTRNAIFDIFIVVVGLALVYLYRKNIFSVINPFVYALVLAYFINPVVNFLEKKKIKRPFAILIVFLVILGTLSIVFMTFIPQLAQDISTFIKEVPNMFEFVVELIEDVRSGKLILIPDALLGVVDFDKELAKIADAIKGSLGQLSTALLASTGTLLDIVMTPIITFYYLNDKKKILALATQNMKPKRLAKVKSVAHEIDLVLGGFIKGQMLVAMFVGILTGVGCAVIGVPYALTIGLVAGLTNIIPYFGPWLGGVTPVILALMNNPITALWVVIWILIVQQIESSFISPQIMSQSVGLHPLTVIFSVLLFGNIFGIPGMIIGVPLMGTLKVLFKYLMDFRKEFRRQPIAQ